MKLVQRFLQWVFAIPLLTVGGFLVWDAATYDAGAWRRDYAHLKTELAQNYANLDWIVEHRGLDLVALDQRTETALEGARTRVQAVLALRAFVRAFGDPHLRMVWRERRMAAQAKSVAPATASASCEGYEASDDVAFTLPVAALRGWRATHNVPFSAGVAGDLGIIRIHAFGEDKYADTCATVLQSGMTEREIQLATRDRLQAALRSTIAELRELGAARLAIDLTGNGGGTEWSAEAAALFSDGVLTRPQTRLAAAACDRSVVWRGEAPPCPVLEPAGEPITLDGEGVWTGPLFLIVDGHTASASEDFVVWLEPRARLVGQRTLGAGCGYVDGGGWIRLEAGPFDVRAPNCARFLADGTNEIEGIAPDTVVDFRGDDATIANALAAALR